MLECGGPEPGLVGQEAGVRLVVHLPQQPAPGAGQGQGARATALLCERRLQHRLVHLQTHVADMCVLERRIPVHLLTGLQRNLRLRRLAHHVQGAVMQTYSCT
jgi:hypothetical protein